MKLKHLLALSAAALCLAPLTARADLIKQGTTYPKTVLVTDANGANVTGLTTASFTTTASKAGAATVAITTPTVTELGQGKYSLALPASLTSTLGALDITLTATGVTQIDSHDQVVGFDPASATVQLPATPPTGYGGTGLTQADYNAIAAALMSSVVDGTITLKQAQTLQLAYEFNPYGRTKTSTSQSLVYQNRAGQNIATVISGLDPMGNVTGRQSATFNLPQ